MRTQPWIADLQDEVITRCSGFWHLANMLPLDGEKAQAGFFRPSEPPSTTMNVIASVTA